MTIPFEEIKARLPGAPGLDFQTWDPQSSLAQNPNPLHRRRSQGVPEGQHENSPG
jgi:hypothetical protein